MALLRLATIAAVVLAAGCQPHATAHVTGASVMYAFAASAEGPPNVPDTSLLVWITDASDLCAQETGGHIPRNKTNLQLTLTDGTDPTVHQGFGQTPSAPGTFTVGALPYLATGNLSVDKDGDCRPAMADFPSSGSVTLTRIDAQGAAGTFDFTWQSGRHTVGSFDAPTCSVLGQEKTMQYLPCG